MCVLISIYFKEIQCNYIICTVVVAVTKKTCFRITSYCYNVLIFGGHEIAGKYRRVRCCWDAVNEMRAAGGWCLRSDCQPDAVHPDAQHPSARSIRQRPGPKTRTVEM